ncbi:MAG TPA: ABC transporter substrate-binding protein [Beijerinckiaceae bacterium]|nr:ABC transporter substrate-binding protein [Beijerinckiaceae bacterium]
MRRREVLAVLMGLGAAPRRACAQALRTARKIGYLHPKTIDPAAPSLIILRPVWERLGYTDPETILFRSADGDPARLPLLVSELVGLGVGVLIAVGPAAVKAASSAATIPVVAIDLETDPVLSGLAASFGRPGGNVTGLFMDQPSLAGKWIDLLREAAPGLERLALLWDPTTTRDQLLSATEAARVRGVPAVTLEVRSPEDYEKAFTNYLRHSRNAGIVHLGSPGTSVNAPGFAAAAREHRLPTIAFLKAYAQSGVLMSYGPEQESYWPRAIVLADRILKGERASDIPIEQPARFEFVINLKTAKEIGLAIQPSLLARADETIE